MSPPACECSVPSSWVWVFISGFLIIISSIFIKSRLTSTAVLRTCSFTIVGSIISQSSWDIFLSSESSPNHLTLLVLKFWDRFSLSWIKASIKFNPEFFARISGISSNASENLSKTICSIPSIVLALFLTCCAINASQDPPPMTMDGCWTNLLRLVIVLWIARWYSSNIIFEFALIKIETVLGLLHPSTNIILSVPIFFSYTFLAYPTLLCMFPTSNSFIRFPPVAFSSQWRSFSFTLLTDIIPNLAKRSCATKSIPLRFITTFIPLSIIICILSLVMLFSSFLNRYICSGLLIDNWDSVFVVLVCRSSSNNRIRAFLTNLGMRSLSIALSISTPSIKILSPKLPIFSSIFMSSASKR